MLSQHSCCLPTVNRSTIVVAVVSTLLVASLVMSGPQAQAAYPAGPVCAIQYIYGSETCYGASNIATAEHGVSFALRPSPIVARTLHVPLTQIIVWRQNAGTNDLLRLEYLYGALPPHGNFNDLRAHPISVDVREDRGRTPSFTTQYVQRACGTAMEISPVTPNQPSHSYGPWFLVANFPHRAATLSIIVNTDEHTLKLLACRILQADRLLAK